MTVFAMSVKTMHKRFRKNQCGLDTLTKKGVCPICKKQVETVWTDIFFPYCGYTCKRVVQREEEAAEKAKVLKQQKWFEDQYEREHERRQRAKTRMEQKLKIEEIRKRIAQCESEYQKNHIEAERLPSGCEKRWRANERAKNWHKKMVETQIQLDKLQKGEEELNDSGRQTDSDSD